MDRSEGHRVGEAGAGPWLSDFSARCMELVEDSVRVGASAAERWGRRALDDDRWTVDTVTADIIADWEEMTPLAGRWLDLWLEAVQQGITGGRPDGP